MLVAGFFLSLVFCFSNAAPWGSSEVDITSTTVASDSDSSGRIYDGGSNAYDYGNYYTIAGCTVPSYSTAWAARTTAGCSGATATQPFYMKQTPQAIYVFASSLVSAQTWSISGNLGNDNLGAISTAKYITTPTVGVYGLRKSSCGGSGRAGVHHLWITNDRSTWESWNPSASSGTDSDADSMTIRAGSSVLLTTYWNVAAGSNVCPITDTEHRAIFDNLANTPSLFAAGCGEPWQPELIYTMPSGSSTIGSTRAPTCSQGYCGTPSVITCQSNGGWTWSSGCYTCSRFGAEPYINTTVADSNFFYITYDQDSNGRIVDGGSNAYDYGNYYTIAGCTVPSYSTLWRERSTSGCSGATATQPFYMRQHFNAMWVWASDLVSNQRWSITGNLGNDNLGAISTAKYITTPTVGVYGLRKSSCGGSGCAGVHHLWITNDRSTWESWNPYVSSGTDSDSDYVDFRAHSSILLVTYWNVASGSNVCPITDSTHLSIFTQLASLSNVMGGVCGDPWQPEGIYLFAAGDYRTGAVRTATCTQGYCGTPSSVVCQTNGGWTWSSGCYTCSRFGVEPYINTTVADSNFFSITYDQDSNGRIVDGGSNAYDYGNYYTIAGCTVPSYSNLWNARSTSGCSGATATQPFYMRQHFNAMWVWASDLVSNQRWSITGNLGNDNLGAGTKAIYQNYGVYGLRKSSCGGSGRAGVHHLWITNDRSTWESWNPSLSSGTDSDSDYVDFRAHSSILLVTYWNVAAGSNVCPITDSTHQSIFTQLASLPNVMGGVCGDPWQPEGIYLFAAGDYRTGAVRTATCTQGYCGTPSSVVCQNNGGWTWSFGCYQCAPWGIEPYVNKTVANSNFFVITYDQDSNGRIVDGGSNAYDYGNYYTIAGCTVPSYSTLWRERSTSGCSGATATQPFYMRQHPDSIYVYAVNLVSTQIWSITGNLGNDNLGAGTKAIYEWFGMYGLRKSSCGGSGRAGVHHLWITNDRSSWESWNPSLSSGTDSDSDYVQIHAGSSVLLTTYWNVASGSNVCPITDSSHLQIFQDLVALPYLTRETCGEPWQPEGIYRFASGGRTLGSIRTATCTQGYCGSPTSVQCLCSGGWTWSSGCYPCSPFGEEPYVNATVANSNFFLITYDQDSNGRIVDGGSNAYDYGNYYTIAGCTVPSYSTLWNARSTSGCSGATATQPFYMRQHPDSIYVYASILVSNQRWSITGNLGNDNLGAGSTAIYTSAPIILTSACTALTGVSITGTAGQFSCSSTTLAVGQTVTLSGTLGGTGTIAGYTGSPTVYYIIATNGSTTFTLSNSPVTAGYQEGYNGRWGAGVVTTAGTPTGLTYTYACVTITGTAGQFQTSLTSLVVGQTVTISGTLGGTGTISGYSDPTTYYVITTNGSTTFTLSTTATGSGITTTVGSPTGLTFTAGRNAVGIYGLRKSSCGGSGRAGVHHLWITNDRKAWETWNPSLSSGTDSDSDYLDIRAGNSILLTTYWNVAAGSNVCPISDASHLAIFNNLVSMDGLMASSCGDPWQPENIYVFASGGTTSGSTRTATCNQGYCGQPTLVTCQSNGGWTWSSGCFPCSKWGPEPYVNATVANSNFFVITYDQDSNGRILDGGSNAYDYGNYYTISGCTVPSYSSLWTERTTAGCSGATATQLFYMRQHPDSIYVFASNLVSDQTWSITGNLGNDNLGAIATATYSKVWSSTTVYGFRKSSCGGSGRAGVHHLWITSDSNAAGSWTRSTNTDDDRDSLLIRRGNFIFVVTYWNVAAGSNVCPITDDMHSAVFNGIQFYSCGPPVQLGYTFADGTNLLTHTRTATCASGWTGIATSITCSGDQNGSVWSASSGCSRVTCPEPSQAGYVFSTGTSTFQSTRTSTCATGYQGVGRLDNEKTYGTIIYCQSGGTWSQAAGCARRQCEASPLQTGYVIRSGGVEVADTRDVICAYGYIGTATQVTCQTDGTWTPAYGCWTTCPAAGAQAIQWTLPVTMRYGWYSSAPLSGVAITGTAGQFSCASTTLAVGQMITISGTLGGSGDVIGYGTLSSVAITGTAGQFSCASTTLAVGQTVTISGTLGGSGLISDYTSPTTYYIIATNGATTYTLSTSSNGVAVTTVPGTPTGLTYSPSSTSYYIIRTNGATTYTLSTSSNGVAVTTVPGTPTGLSYTPYSRWNTNTWGPSQTAAAISGMALSLGIAPSDISMKRMYMDGDQLVIEWEIIVASEDAANTKTDMIDAGMVQVDASLGSVQLTASDPVSHEIVEGEQEPEALYTVPLEFSFADKTTSTWTSSDESTLISDIASSLGVDELDITITDRQNVDGNLVVSCEILNVPTEYDAIMMQGAIANGDITVSDSLGETTVSTGELVQIKYIFRVSVVLEFPAFTLATWTTELQKLAQENMADSLGVDYTQITFTRIYEVEGVLTIDADVDGLPTQDAAEDKVAMMNTYSMLTFDDVLCGDDPVTYLAADPVEAEQSSGTVYPRSMQFVFRNKNSYSWTTEDQDLFLQNLANFYNITVEDISIDGSRDSYPDGYLILELTISFPNDYSATAGLYAAEEGEVILDDSFGPFEAGTVPEPTEPPTEPPASSQQSQQFFSEAGNAHVTWVIVAVVFVFEQQR